MMIVMKRRRKPDDDYNEGDDNDDKEDDNYDFHVTVDVCDDDDNGNDDMAMMRMTLRVMLSPRCIIAYRKSPLFAALLAVDNNLIMLLMIS